MYCVKVTPGTERIRVRSISSGFLPSYVPAADPDAPFAFSSVDGASSASSGKKARKLIVPGYVFSLQRSPTAKLVDPEEWKIIDALSDSRASVFDPSLLKFIEGPMMGLENLVTHVGEDHVQIKAIILEEERTYYVHVTTASEEFEKMMTNQQAATKNETKDEKGKNDKTAMTEDKEVEEFYSQDRIDNVLADAENIGVYAAGRKHGIPWQTISGWKKKAKVVKDPTQKKTVGRNGRKPAGEKPPAEEKKKPGRKKTSETKTLKDDFVEETVNKPMSNLDDAVKAVQVSDDQEANPLEIENAMLRERVANLEAKIEKMKKAIADLM